MKYLRPATPRFFEFFKQSGFAGKLALAISSCLGLGLIPIAQGTFGALAGIPLAIILTRFGILPRVYLLFFLILLAVCASGLSAKALQSQDPPEVVIDEMAGMLIACFMVPLSLSSLCFGFFLFRLFDILKPFPIRRLEKVGGGPGIVLDDLLAGIYANLCLRIFGMSV